MDIGFNIFNQSNSHLLDQYPLLDQSLFPTPERLAGLPSGLMGVEKLNLEVFTPTTPKSALTVNSNFSGLQPPVDPLIGAEPVVSAEVINISLLQVGQSLNDFLQQPNYLDSLQIAFGSQWQAQTATTIITDLAQGENLPEIKIVKGEELQAEGAFSQQTNTIYLSQEFVEQNSTNTITTVLTEEIGHYLDSQLNPVDSPGDEGEIFAHIVQNYSPDSQLLAAKQQEDDHATRWLNGQLIRLEQASLTQNSAITRLDRLGEVLRVPGNNSEGTSLLFQWTAKEAAYNNEIGVFVVDEQGQVNGVKPGEVGYAQAALTSASRQVLFTSGQTAGGWRQLTFQEGQYLAFYLIQNNTTEGWLATNPQNQLDKQTLAFFSIHGANPDKFNHVKSQDMGESIWQLRWEDLVNGGDKDFNDVVFNVSLLGLQVPGNLGQTASTQISLLGTEASFKHEMGLFFVDDLHGKINNLAPEHPNYIKAALSAERRKDIFAFGQTPSTAINFDLPSGQYIGWYLITNGTTEQFLKDNPNNISGSSINAFFSYAGANHDGLSHVHHQSSNELVWEDLFKGSDRDYNDLTFRFTFRTPNEINNSPTGISLNLIDNYENIAADSVIGILNTVAPNPQDTHVYSLVSGAGDEDNTAFKIIENKLIINQSPDFETKPTYKIRVRNTDPGGLSFEQNFIVNITNVNEAPVISLPADQFVEENTDLIINGISISDVDATSGELQVSLTANQGLLTLGQTTGINFITGDGTANSTLTFTGTLTAINQALANLAYRSHPNFLGDDTISLTVNDQGNSGSGGTLSATDSLKVTVSSSANILLREDNFFARTYEQNINIPDTNSVLSFTYSNLKFDTTDPNDINDAFEVALVDAQGNSLVHTIKANHDAFFNFTEDQPLALAAGTTVDGQTVKVNLSGLAPGSAKLIFRLVNNDSDTKTTVRLNNIQILPTEGITPVAATPEVSLRVVNAPIDFKLLSDVTSSFVPEYQRTSFNEDTKILYADLAVRNTGTYLVDAPLVVAIKSLSDPTVQVVGADGLTPEGLPFFNLSNLVADGSLDPNETTQAKTISFFNPQQAQFYYELVFLGQLNSAPKFISDPDVEAVVGKSYIYETKAEDVNNDTLTYSLLVAPEGMLIDSATGKITWNTDTVEIGNYTVSVQVADNRGGFDIQNYILGAIAPPPNRPPIFISTPIIDARVNTAYQYQAIATDPDSDNLTFSLVSSPEGMTIDQQTGLISWTPNATGEREVRLKVEDGKGGVSEQIYQILAQQEAGNHAPVIISEAIIKAAQNQNYVYDVNALDADSDNLTYSFIAAPERMTINPETGEIIWDTINQAIGNYDVTVRVEDSHGGVDTQEFVIALSNQPLGEIRGTKWDDLNGNSFRDTELVQGKEPDVIFVFDVSGSADYAFQGTSIGDVNKDGLNNTILDAELAAFLELNNQLIRQGLGNKARVGIVVFSGFSAQADMDLVTSGVQLVTTPSADQNNNGIADVEDILRSIRSGAFGVGNNTGTNFEIALQKVENTFQTIGTTSGNGNMIFLSDGEINRGGSHADEVQRLRTLGVTLSAFGVGQGASLNSLKVIDPNAKVFLSTDELLNVFSGLQGEERFVEPGLAGVTVYLDLNNNGLLDSNEPTQITASDNPNTLNIDETGQYKFTKLEAGTYIVREIVPRGYKQTFPFGQTTGTGDGYADVVLEYFAAGNSPSPLPEPYGSNGGYPPRTVQNGGYTIEPVSPNVILGSPPPSPVVSGNPQVDWLALPQGSYVTVGFTDEVAIDGIGDDIFIQSFDPQDSANEFANVYVSSNGKDFTFLGKINERGLVSLDLATIGYKESVTAVRIEGLDNQGTSPGFDLIAVRILPSSIASPDFYTVNLKADEAVENINFGNQKTEEITPNKPPTFNSTAPITAQIGELLRYQAIANDPDGDRLTFDLPVKPEGMAVDENTGILVWNPNFDQIGVHEVILRVQDGNGGVNLQTFQLNVTAANTPSLITSTPPQQAVANLPYQYKVRAQDAEGDTLTYSLTAAPDGMTINETTGVINYTPTAAQLGDRTVEITITDSQGATTTQSYTLKVVASANNNLPTITSTPRDRIRLGSDYYYIAEVTDPDGDPLTFSLENAPSGMSVDEEGIIRWTPSAEQFGANSVTLTLTDGRGTPVTQTFTIDVISQNSNQAPTIDSTAPLVATANRQYQYNIVTNDPDGDPVVLNLKEAPQGMSIDPISGKIRWTPRVDQIGSHEVIVEAFDGQGGLTQQTFTITVRGANLPPVITSNPPTIGILNKVYTYQVKATDPENDTLTYSLINNLPEEMTIDAKTGLIQWTPSQLGEQQIQILVNDGQGGVNIQTFRLQVLEKAPNQLPTITSKPVVMVTPGAEYQYDVDAADPESTAIAYSLQTNPDGMTIDPQTGLIKWQTTSNLQGEIPVIVVATDTDDGRAIQSFKVKVAANDAPVIISNPVTNILQGQNYRYDIQATDANGDRLTYTLVNAPEGVTLDTFGRLVWNSKNLGQYPIEIKVEDGRGGVATQSYDLTVIGDTQAPLIELGNNRSLFKPGDTLKLQVRATDNVGVESLNLTFNGLPLALNPGQFIAGNIQTATVTLNQSGVFEVLAQATDAAGNIGTKSLQVRVFNPADNQAPVVTIDQSKFQATGGIITNLTDIIGTVTDDNLEFYRVQYAPVSLIDLNNSADFDPDYITIAQGNSNVVNTVLGQIDPTVLRNDSYFVRVIARDVNGLVNSQGVVLSVNSENKPGRFALEFTDLSIPLAGIPIEIQRRYDSLDASFSGDFGYGWSLGFQDAQIQEASPTGVDLSLDDFFGGNSFTIGTRVTLTTPDGRRVGYTFNPTPDAAGFLGTRYKPNFTPDAGVYDRLEVDYTPLNVRSDGSVGLYVFGFSYNPSQYRLITKDGITYRYDQHQGLLDVTDRNGNKLTYTDAGIVSSTGQSITFRRDAQGRIVEILDPAGQSLKYSYDAKGDLTAFTDFTNNATQYTYDTSLLHYLREITDPLGRKGTRTEYDDQGRLTRLIDAEGNALDLSYSGGASSQTIKDPLGNTITRVFDVQGNVVQEVDALSGITNRTFDKNNNLLSETDPEGNTKAYTYDSRGNKLTETDGEGNVTRYTYNVNNKLLTETDPLGNTTTYTYDAKGNLLNRKDGLGNVTSYKYDAIGNLTSVVDPTGKQSTFVYDFYGNLTQLIDPTGAKTSFSYDKNGRILSTTDALGHITNYTYDAQGRLIAKADPEGSSCGCARGITQIEYNAAGEKIAEVDALGRRTEYRYNERGLLIEVIYADDTPDNLTDNPRIKNEYDKLDRLIASIDEAGRKTHYIYDKLGRRIEVIYPDATPNDLTDNPRTKTEYDKAGRVITEIDELGNRTEFVYDKASRQLTRRNALSQETKYVYDGAGRQISMVDALGRDTDYSYDALGRLLVTEYVDETKQTKTYDLLGRIIAETDQAGNITRFEYDALGRLTAVIDALNQRTEYKYDAVGNLVEQKDANGHVTKFEYDSLRRRQAMILPDGQRNETIHNKIGNLIRTTDFNGVTTTYEYDAQNRLIEKFFSDGTPTETFTYTLTGELASVTDNRGVTSYVYDQRDRLLSRTEADGRQIAYTYDLAGNITSLIVPSGTTTYTYDPLNRIATVTDPDSGVTRYTYDAVGNLIKTEFPNRVIETQTYNDLNRLTYLENRNQTGIISSYSYTLDAVGNRTKVEENNGRVVEYSYDQLYRLTQEKITDAVAGNKIVTYKFDPVGNRLERIDSIEGTTAYSYDANDRLLEEVLGGKVTQYQYDSNGNLTATIENGQTQTQYEWNAKGELVAVETTENGETGRVEFEYNHEGIRVAIKVGGEETRFLIDKNQQQYAQVIEEYKPDGTVDASYVHGWDLISQENADGRIYYQVDGLGSTRQLTDINGAAMTEYVYDAYGQLTRLVGNEANNYLFTGEQFEDAVDAYYLRARYYDQSNGRFISKDSFEGYIILPVTLHDYLFTNANPTNFIDPSGNATLIEYRPLIADIFASRTCPSVEPKSDPTWVPYKGDSIYFHCGFTGYVENRKPTPGQPQLECFYDNCGNLVDTKHPYAGCGGTANQYDAEDDPLWHSLFDLGGIWYSGGRAWKESRKFFKEKGVKLPCSK